MLSLAIRFCSVWLFLLIFLWTPPLTAASEKLEYWTPFSGGDARPMSNLVSRFNQSQLDLSVTMVNQVWDTYYDKLFQAHQQGSLPDVAVVHASKISQLVSKGILNDITDLGPKYGINWDEFDKNSLNASSLFERNYGIPLDSHALVFFYNKSLLRDANLLDQEGKPELGQGVEGLVGFFRRLKNALPLNVSAISSPTENVYPFWVWYAIYSQIDGGGQYIEDNRSTFNNPAARQAAELLLQLRDEGFWNNGIEDKKGYNLFKFGYSASMFSGVWATWNFEQMNELDFGVVPLPRIFDREATWGDSHVLVFPKGNTNSQLKTALGFADWVSKNSAGWAVAGHTPARNSVLQSQEFRAMPKRPGYVDVLQTVNHYPSHKALWECNAIMVDLFVRLFDGELALDEGFDWAEKKVNAILSANMAQR